MDASAKKKHTEMNKQNYHIAIQHENSQNAIKVLMEKNITVLSVEIQSTCPVITDMETPHVNKLKGVITTSTIGNGLGRRQVKATKVSNCLVQWTSNHVIH
jgi:hypothetical protein